MELKYKHTILLVDDEPSIIKSLQRLFRKENYILLTATDPVAGLEIVKKGDHPISLFISDQRMPGLSGSQFLEEARKHFPNAVRFLLTGYADLDAVIDAVNKGQITRYIRKPWNDEDLLLQVRQGLLQYELLVENRRLMNLTRKQNQELCKLNRSLEEKVAERSREILDKNQRLQALHQRLEANFFNAIRAFAALFAKQAPVLAGHGRRVSHLARQMAEQMGLPPQEVTNIEIAGLLHDVGKLGMPDRIQDYQERKWDEKDLALYRRHPEEGQVIIRFIDRLDPVGRLIRLHHERYDGNGYPDGLTDKEIPAGARIIAVANAYDRIFNLELNKKECIAEFLKENPFNKESGDETGELQQQAAVHYLKKNALIQFDPDVVKIFLNCLQGVCVLRRKEEQVALRELKPGMRLARAIYTARGQFLLPQDSYLTEDYIQKLKLILSDDPRRDNIYILGKNSTDESGNPGE